MRRIQEVALDLFDRYGFEAVTIEQIADAAEVSPRSVYRYFGTKEQVVLHDEIDLQFLDLVESELAAHAPVEAVRRALAKAMTAFFGREEELARRKMRYWAQEPALQAAAAGLSDEFAQLVAAALGRAAGRRPDDLEVQVVAATLVWSLVVAARHWQAGGYVKPLEQELQAALDVVERGLRLEPAPETPRNQLPS